MTSYLTFFFHPEQPLNLRVKLFPAHTQFSVASKPEVGHGDRTLDGDRTVVDLQQVLCLCGHYVAETLVVRATVEQQVTSDIQVKYCSWSWNNELFMITDRQILLLIELCDLLTTSY